MVSFDFVNGHLSTCLILLACIAAIVLIIALWRKDSVKASGQYKDIGFSLEARNHPKPKPRELTKRSRSKITRIDVPLTNMKSYNSGSKKRSSEVNGYNSANR